MSAETSTSVELYKGPAPYLRMLPQEVITEQPPADYEIIDIPLHPELSESAVHIRNPDSKCFPDCPIIMHGISEIMDEPDLAVVQSIVNWVKGVNEKCYEGPQTTRRPRFFIVGAEIKEVTCGSQLSGHHKDLRTKRTDT